MELNMMCMSPHKDMHKDGRAIAVLPVLSYIIFGSSWIIQR
jgi:hypothetical protein